MNLMQPSAKMLIDAGPSSAGWSSTSSFLRCERLFFHERARRKAEAAGPVTHASKLPLTRGSLIHVGLAHEYARRGAAQQGLDPEVYYDRISAMQVWASKQPKELESGECMSDVLDTATEMVQSYFNHYNARGENLRVLAVEAPVELELPGGNLATMRLDLVIMDDAGRVYIVDHKGTSETSKQKLVARYSLSGQFLLMTLIGQKYYGPAFAGCMINVVSARSDRGPDARFYRFAPQPAPAALQEFPVMLGRVRSRIKELEGQGAEAYRPAFEETICAGGYDSKCPHYEKCCWGA